jgi:hypothetical protein
LSPLLDFADISHHFTSLVFFDVTHDTSVPDSSAKAVYAILGNAMGAQLGAQVVAFPFTPAVGKLRLWALDLRVLLLEIWWRVWPLLQRDPIFLTARDDHRLEHTQIQANLLGWLVVSSLVDFTSRRTSCFPVRPSTAVTRWGMSVHKPSDLCSRLSTFPLSLRRAPDTSAFATFWPAWVSGCSL